MRIEPSRSAAAGDLKDDCEGQQTKGFAGTVFAEILHPV